MTIKKILVCFLVFSCLVLSCTKKEPEHSEIIEEKSPWQPSDERVGIVFANGYNEKTYIEEMLELFASQYGLDEENGLIKPIVFPDDFIIAGTKKTQIKFLSNFVNDENFKMLIILGNPENTHEALSKIKDREQPISVISLFSQDSILGTQYGSDIVLDLDTSLNALETEQHQQSLSAKELFLLLSPFIKDYSLLEQLKGDSKKLTHYVKNTLKEKWILTQYQDPETEIKAQNHFVLKINN